MTHAPTVKCQNSGGLGRLYRMACTCGRFSAWTSDKQTAEDACTTHERNYT